MVVKANRRIWINRLTDVGHSRERHDLDDRFLMLCLAMDIIEASGGASVNYVVLSSCFDPFTKKSNVK